MAFQNKKIRNLKTGQEIKFIRTAKDTGGQLLEMESTYHSRSKEPPPHYHPNQVEDFTVVSGFLTVRIDGVVRVLRKGDKLRVAKNQVHSMWNNTDEKTVIHWKVHPAMETDNFLETLIGLANDGKTNNEGVPAILQVAPIAIKYSDVFRLAKPPFAVQKILFTVLMPFSYLLGYRSSYKKYLD